MPLARAARPSSLSRRSALQLVPSLVLVAGTGCAETGGSLRGRALHRSSGTEQPLRSASIALRSCASGAVVLGSQVGSDGGFFFEVPAGSYRLLIAAPGFVDLESEPIQVEQGPVDAGDFLLAPPRGTWTVAGRTSCAGRPLPGVEIVIMRFVGGWQPWREAGSGAHGRFVISGLAGGTYRIDLFKLGYERVSSSPFDIVASVSDLELELPGPIVDTFRFAIISDAHVYRNGAVAPDFEQVVRATVEQIAPSLVVFTGDMTSGTSATPLDIESCLHYWESFFGTIAGLSTAGIAVFPVRGNHDYASPAQRIVYDDLWHDHKVPGVIVQGDTEGYYSFDVGSCHFTVLAGDTPSLDVEQVEWLRADLASAAVATHRFVFCHIPLVAKVRNKNGTVGYGEVSGSTSDGVSLEEVLVGLDVTALFVGHEHVFVDDPVAVPGLRQVTCGTASAIYSFPFLDGSQQGLAASLVVVDVIGDQLRIYGARAPDFATTWDGVVIPAPLPPLRTS